MTTKNRRISLLATNLDENGNILQEGIAGNVSLGGVVIYDSASSLPDSASTGDQAFVTSNQKLYIHNGFSWYSTGIINATPIITRAYDSDTTNISPFLITGESLTITINAIDSDADTIFYSATPDSDFSSLVGTVSNTGNVFTISPYDSDVSPGGAGTITFKASDGANIGTSLAEFNLTFTGWDISSLSFEKYDLGKWQVKYLRAWESFSVAAQETTPEGLFFKPDGTKMYIVGVTGDDVNEYDLSTAWEVSSATYLQNFSVAAQEANPQGIFFKPDGTKMYVIGLTADAVNEYDLSTAWDVSSATHLQNFSVALQDNAPHDIFFKPDGTKMYIVGQDNDDVNEYDLSTAWDVSSATHLQSFRVLSIETTPTGLFFKPDGTKMYIVGESGDDVNEYDLSTAWDISSATFVESTASLQSITTIGGTVGMANPSGLYINDDGVFFVVSTSADTVTSYRPYKLLNLGSDEEKLFIRNDGLKLYTVSPSSDQIREYSLSIPYDITTATFEHSVNVENPETFPLGIMFKSDGTKMYTTGTGAGITQFSLPTSWDISTAPCRPCDVVTNLNFKNVDSVLESAYFKPDGTKIYVLGSQNDNVYEWTLGTAWDITSETLTHTLNISSYHTVPHDIFFRNDGKKMYIVGDPSDNLTEWNLTTAWDLSSATYVQAVSFSARTDIDLAGPSSNPQGVWINPNGKEIYLNVLSNTLIAGTL